ncbi:MAG: hypothetical protein AB8C95_11975 [Phycisphaeraceae bacterium]
MFNTATKLTVIAEHFLSKDICEIIEAGGGKGYTLIPVGGKGLHHLHPMLDQATVIEGFDNLKIELITSDRTKAEQIAERIMDECLRNQPGIMYLEKVEVSRSERF